MTVIKRYDGKVSHHAEGGYVSIKDHAKFIDGRDREIEQMFKQVKKLTEERDALQGQVQKLTEERDSATLQFDYMQDQINFHWERAQKLSYDLSQRDAMDEQPGELFGGRLRGDGAFWYSETIVRALLAAQARSQVKAVKPTVCQHKWVSSEGRTASGWLCSICGDYDGPTGTKEKDND